MKKTVIVVLFILLLVFFGCTISVNPQDLAPSKKYAVISDGNSNYGPGDSNFPQSKLVLDSTEVAKHNSNGNCWMILNGNVYDLSEYVSHPGGNQYLIYCGKEATSEYDTKDGRGMMHSDYADALLANYLIGKLGQEVLISDVNMLAFI